MLSVLINAYAISPSWGSEQGVGWHWMTEIAKHCRVFVITEGQWRDEIENAIRKLPQQGNIKMYYNPVSARVRRMCWNQGDYRFYFHYACWQRKTLKIAREIVKENKIDIIHQLNMVGFREPGYLWEISNIPFVWGPFGGAHPINLKYIDGLIPKIFYFNKNIISKVQLKYSPRVSKAIKSARVLITPLKEDAMEIFKVYGRSSEIISETGIEADAVLSGWTEKSEDYFNILWVGKFAERKKLDIAIRSIAKMTSSKTVRFHIVGTGTSKDIKKYKNLSKTEGIEKNCIWYGSVTNAEVKVMMQKMDLLFFSSIHELTSTVVPEAIQNRLPILCHDAMGFGPVVEDGKTGFKIPLINPQQSISRFASILGRLSENKAVLNDMKFNFDEPAKCLSFEEKGKRVLEMYNQIIRSNI